MHGILSLCGGCRMHEFDFIFIEFAVHFKCVFERDYRVTNAYSDAKAHTLDGALFL